MVRTLPASLLIPACLSLIVMPAAHAAGTPPDAASEYFEQHVRPVLANNCYTCHGPKNQMAGLRLDSRESLLKGAEGGKQVIIPGDPAHSELLKAVSYKSDVKMPPSGPLSAPDVAALTEWVRMGAPWPGSGAGAVPTEAWRKHWSFLPVRLPAIPRVQSAGWVKSPIDAFVLANLERQGMKPAPQADRRTLIRRATYDLTGLPPTPGEVADFENDRSPDAFAHVVDRLLASPHYGERWARYWLDVARYADNKGYVFTEDREYPYAYTYRDWLIRSLNADVPYDRFIKDQLAADLLPGGDRSSLAALGFLTVGRRFLNNPPDIIDDRIDVTCRGFLGLTVECARCHNHKFDPIPTADYYSLYGVFESSPEPVDLPVIDNPARVEAYRIYDTELKSRQNALAAYQKAQAAPLKAGDAHAKTEEARLKGLVDAWQAHAPPMPARAMVVNDAPKPSEPHIFLRGKPENVGPQVPRQFLMVLAGEHRTPFQHGSGRLELADDIANPDNPLTSRVIVNRVWMHHFGDGLVRTPSDFGMRSDPPTEPELLDYLAYRFVREGWSLKKLHRLIMLSSTYQQSSRDDPAYLKRDPENRYLWKMNRQRLDFEAMRDSLLAASGRLDLTIGGPSVPMTDPPYTNRRTMYGYIDRQNLPGLFRTFDFATPDMHSPQRHVTTVPPQALFLMNSPFVVEQARGLADRVSTFESPDRRIRAMYHLLFTRNPTAHELDLGRRYLAIANGEAPPYAGPSTAWQYGYGEFDPAASRVKTFTRLSHWTGEVWRIGADFPDKTLGFLILTPTGGHVGNDLHHAVIRRWTSPFDGVVSVSGEIGHTQEKGDGVHAMIVSSRQGALGSWNVFHSSARTEVARAVVKKGDTIDFVVDCRSAPDYDSFTWAPRIQRTGVPSPNDPDLPTIWSAHDDFSGPSPSVKPLDVWGQYAQVLLMTNEFSFVD